MATTSTARPRRIGKGEPRILDLPTRTMAVVHTTGDPSAVGPQVLPALYKAVYSYKFARKKVGADFKVEPLRARWFLLDAAGQWVSDRTRWEAAWGIPLPDGTEQLPSVSSSVTITIEEWRYGTVAEILHEGPYATEAPTIERLHAFIAEQGYKIAGAHEEEYLTRPDAKAPRTIVRYPVRRVSNGPVLG